jgi:prevent-host-death family protein
MTMDGVRVADLKSRLSEHLRKVRRGRSVTVLDRNTPIARIVPYEERASSLRVRSPLPGTSLLKDVRLPSPLKLRRDIVALLLEEPQGER